MVGFRGEPFARERLAGPSLDAAERLLWALLVRRMPGVADRVGRIVEVEAYGGPEDRASHARAGHTARTAPMFGPAGHAYVYLVYGMHDCLNVVTGPDGAASAVLIRAVEPVAGLDVMRTGLARRAAAREARRGASSAFARATAGARPGGDQPGHRLATGPGRLCAAFEIDRSFSGTDLCAADGPLTLASGAVVDPASIVRTPRIGVGYAAPPWHAIAWRVLIAGNPSVSGPRAPASD